MCREWTVNAPTAVLTGRSTSAPMAFRLKAGEAVQGLTGVVTTTRARTPDIDDQARDSEIDIRIVSHPTTVWWVKVRNESGRTGWTRQTDHFDHMDACES